MAMAWKDVIASQQFQQLNPQQQAEAQEQYFNQVIAPQVGDQTEAARTQFFSQFPPAQAMQQVQQPAQQVTQADPNAMLQQQTDQQVAQQDGAAGGFLGDAALGVAEAGRAIGTAAINTANIIPEIGDAAVSAAAWLGKKLGVGDGTYTPAARIPVPDFLQPQTDAGKIAAEALPYVANPAAGAERALASLPSRADRIAGRAAGMVAENTTGALAQNSGIGDDDLAEDLGMGALASGAVRGALGIGGAAVGAVRRVAGGGGDGAAQEAARIAQQTTPQGAADAVVPPVPAEVAEGRGLATELQEVAQGAAQGASREGAGGASFASRIIPDEQVLESASRIGVDGALTPGMYSQNPAYRAFENALASVPSRETYHAQREAIGRVGQAADNFIQEFGGTLDKSFANQQVRDGYTKLLKNIGEEESKLYNQVSQAIPPRLPVQANNTIDAIMSYADDLGGSANLPAPLKSLLAKLDPVAAKAGDEPATTVTYALLDAARKDIGRAGANRGAFKDEDKALLDRLYSTLTEDQGAVAAQHGVGDLWKAAKAMSVQRFGVQDAAVSSLGKNLDGDVVSRLQKTITDMSSGGGESFRTAVNNLPPDMRRPAVMTALNKAFTTNAKSPGQQLGVPGFVKWYNGMMRNKGNLQSLSRVIGYDGAKRLNDIYQVANGINRMGSERQYASGVINRVLDDFDKNGGLLTKVYQTGKRAIAAEGVTSSLGVPGVGAASAIVQAAAAPKTPVVEAADKMIASGAFRAFARDLARGQRAREAAESVLSRSPAYRRWYNALDAETQQAIARGGFLGWVAQTEE